jgi:hypothetical protein
LNEENQQLKQKLAAFTKDNFESTIKVELKNFRKFP